MHTYTTATTLFHALHSTPFEPLTSPLDFLTLLLVRMDILAAAAAAAPPPLLPPPSPLSRLSQLERWSCVVLDKEGKSSRAIARQLGVHRNTVRDVLARFAATGTPNSGSRSGRPRCTDEATDTNIAVTARVEPFTSARQVRRKLDMDASARTVDRRLQEAGLFGRVAVHKRDYSDPELRKRLSFAEGHADWTVQQWEKVIFSDEKTFYGKGFCGQTWVRRPKGEALNPDFTVHKQAHPVKVGMWACFSAAGPGYSTVFSDNMDAVLMRNTLDTNLLPTAQHFGFLGPPPVQWYLLHDNDKKFKSIKVTEWLHNKGVTALDFPPYSPDLNPIENLWAIVAREVEKWSAETVEELGDVIVEEWENVDVNVCRSLAHSMPERCKVVIEAKGWHTKY